MTRKLLAGALLALVAVFAIPTIANAAGDADEGSAATVNVGATVSIASDGQMLAVWVGVGVFLLAAAYIMVMINVRRGRAAA